MQGFTIIYRPYYLYLHRAYPAPGGKENGRKSLRKKKLRSSSPERKSSSTSSSEEDLRLKKKRAQRSQSVPPEQMALKSSGLGVITPPLNYKDKPKCSSLPRVIVRSSGPAKHSAIPMSSGDEETDSIVTVKRAGGANGRKFEKSVSTPILLSPGEECSDNFGMYGKKANSLVFERNLGGENDDNFFGAQALRKNDSFEGHEEAIESLVRALKGTKAKKGSNGKH